MTLGSLVLLVVANNNSGVVALPSIAATFDAGPADVAWVAFGYMATFAVATASWGVLGRVFGAGRSLAVAATILAAGSALAVVAPTLPALVLARLLQGAGAGAVPTLAASIVADTYEPERRARPMGVVFAGMGAGLAIGPVLGALALELGHWRLAIALGVLAFPLALVALRMPSLGGGAMPGMRSVVATAVFCLSAVHLANRFLLESNGLLLLGPALVLAGALLVIFRFPGRRPLIPVAALRSTTFRWPALAGASGMGSFVGILVVAPIAQAATQGLDGFGLGMLLLPLAVTSALTSHQIGRVVARIGGWPVVCGGLASLALAAIALAVAPAAPPPVLAVLLVPAGIGFGMIRAPLLAIATDTDDPAIRPSLAGAHNLAFFLGGAFGTAVATGVLQASAGGNIATGVTNASVMLAMFPGGALLAVASRRWLRGGFR